MLPHSSRFSMDGWKQNNCQVEIEVGGIVTRHAKYSSTKGHRIENIYQVDKGNQ